MHLKPPDEVAEAIESHTKDWPSMKRLIHAANVWSAYARALHLQHQDVLRKLIVLQKAATQSSNN